MILIDSLNGADIGGATRQLLQQNSWAFKQISANIATHNVINISSSFLVLMIDSDSFNEST